VLKLRYSGTAKAGRGMSVVEQVISTGIAGVETTIKRKKRKVNHELHELHE
jgi:hypothetical protein